MISVCRTDHWETEHFIAGQGRAATSTCTLTPASATAWPSYQMLVQLQICWATVDMWLSKNGNSNSLVTTKCHPKRYYHLRFMFCIGKYLVLVLVTITVLWCCMMMLEIAMYWICQTATAGCGNKGVALQHRTIQRPLTLRLCGLSSTQFQGQTRAMTPLVLALSLSLLAVKSKFSLLRLASHSDQTGPDWQKKGSEVSEIQIKRGLGWDCII